MSDLQENILKLEVRSIAYINDIQQVTVEVKTLISQQILNIFKQSCKQRKRIELLRRYKQIEYKIFIYEKFIIANIGLIRLPQNGSHKAALIMYV